MAKWLYSNEGKKFCHQCKIVAEKTKKDIDCETCTNKMPEVSYELQALLDCFVTCEYQLKVGFSGAYALDYSTLLRVADDMGIKTNKTFYRLLKVFENILIIEINKNKK